MRGESRARDPSSGHVGLRGSQGGARMSGPRALGGLTGSDLG
jgi:hypothetical protein